MQLVRIDLSFYPNPSAGNFSVQFDLTTVKHKNARIVIKNIVGYSLSQDTNFTWLQLTNNSIYFQAWCDSVDFAGVNFTVGIDRVKNGFSPMASLPFRNSTSAQGMIVTDTLYHGSNRIGTIQSLIQNWNGRYSIEYAIYPDSVMTVSGNDTSRYYWKFQTTGSGRLDAWSFDMVFDNLPLISTYPQIAFYKRPETDQTIVSSFTCSDKVITVGSYTNRNYYTNANYAITRDTSLHPGNLSAFSSRGPTRDGRIKPDITATGEWVLSCGTQSEMNLLASLEPEKVAAGKKHKRSRGTSMSSPVVAGIAALYLQKNPHATWSDVKMALLNCADRDQSTGFNLPDNQWGYGKVNAYAAIKGCQTGIDDYDMHHADLSFYPNPSNGVFSIQFDLTTVKYKSARIIIKNIVGQTVAEIPLQGFAGSIEQRLQLLPGVYSGTLVADGKSVITKRISVIL